MAIIYDNRLYTIGDEYLVRMEITRDGTYIVEDFADSTENETVDRFFEKQVRRSIDNGITFTPWTTLTTINVQAEFTVSSANIIVYEFLYTRAGTDLTGNIALNYVQLLGQLTSSTPRQIIVHNITLSANQVF